MHQPAGCATLCGRRSLERQFEDEDGSCCRSQACRRLLRLPGSPPPRPAAAGPARRRFLADRVTGRCPAVARPDHQPSRSGSHRRRSRTSLRLAKEQGHLTYDDLNDALPDDVVTPADLDQVLTKLRNLEIDIIDAAEVERGRQPEADEEEEGGRYDILDDPVRMYLRQMGKVPLLTREQEVEICKRIEAAEQEARRHHLRLRLCRQRAPGAGGEAAGRAAQGAV